MSHTPFNDFAPTFGFSADEPLAGTELPGIDFVALARGRRWVLSSRFTSWNDCLGCPIQANQPLPEKFRRTSIILVWFQDYRRNPHRRSEK